MRASRALFALVFAGCSGDVLESDPPDSDPPDSDTDCEVRRWYTDLDRDSFGDDGSFTDACDTPPGTSERAGDCDDQDAAVNPDALEVCGNGADDDCDGAAPSCRPEGSVALSAWARVLVDSEPGEGFGTVVDLVPDVDGDGRMDLLVSRPLDDRVRPGAGYVALYAGSALDIGRPWAGFRRRIDNENLGQAAAAGDPDGDGAADLLLASPRTPQGSSEDVGAVHMIRGPLVAGERDLGTTPAVVWTGASRKDNAGRAVAWLEVDGGIALVGAPEPTGDKAGRVYLMAVDTPSGGLADVAAGSVVGGATDARLGEVVIPLGDIDGDGVPAWVVGAARRTGAEATWRVFEGKPTGTVAAADAERTLDGGLRVTLQPGVIGAGDLDGDGHRDLVVGAPAYADPSADAGAILVFHGPPTGAWTLAGATGRIEGAGRSRLGARVAVADLDGDGVDDVAAMSDPAGGGAALHLHYGDVRGALSSTSATLGAPSDARRFGQALAAGDPDGDGAASVFVGAPGFSGDLGRVFLVDWPGL